VGHESRSLQGEVMRARYQFVGEMPAVQADKEHDELMEFVGFLDGVVPFGHVFDQQGRFISEVTTKEQCVLLLDGLVRRAQMDADDAIHVRSQVQGCEKLLGTRSAFRMTERVARCGGVIAELSIAGFILEVASKRHAIDLITQAVQLNRVHPAFTQEVTEAINSSDLPEDLSRVECLEGSAGLFDYAGNLCGEFDSFDIGYSAIMGGDSLKTIFNDDDRARLMVQLSEMHQEGKLTGVGSIT